MWKNIAQWGRPHMTIWRMRIACWIPKATNTYSEYVRHIYIPLQRHIDFPRLHITAYRNPLFLLLNDAFIHRYCSPNTLLFLGNWFHWPRGLRCGFAAALLLGLRVQIPPGTWMSLSCECSVLSGRGLCDELITLPEQYHRVWCFWAWSLSRVRTAWHGIGSKRQK
jgi:hypothetical protein